MASIPTEILAALYDAFFLHGGHLNLESLRRERSWELNGFRRHRDRLIYDGLIGHYDFGSIFKMTPKGLLYAEKNRLSDEELRRINLDLRAAVMELLGRVYDDKGPVGALRHRKIADELDVPMDLLMANLDLLSDLGYIAARAWDFYYLTRSGVGVARNRSASRRVVEELTKIERMPESPKRQREFQDFFLRLLGYQRWAHHVAEIEGMGMDLIHREREHYLLSCRWPAQRVRTPEVEAMARQLRTGIGLRGVLVSMAGFTLGAARQASRSAGDRILLFFGPQDVRSIVQGTSDFAGLLRAKYDKLVNERQLLFE